jgi:hypothetical protein
MLDTLSINYKSFRKQLNLSLAIFFTLLFIGCNSAPETYKQGVKFIAEKKYDKAIESFSKVKEEEKSWFDSAKVKKIESLKLMMVANDWALISETLKNYKSDKAFFDGSVVQIEKLFKEKSKKGDLDGIFKIIDDNRKVFDQSIDSNFTNKILAVVEDIIFEGTWVGINGKIKGHEIYFKRLGASLNGFSNTDIDGWDKDDIIYKNAVYKAKKQWKIFPKLFGKRSRSRYSYYGTLSLTARDTILIGYDEAGFSRTFTRKK